MNKPGIHSGFLLVMSLIFSATAADNETRSSINPIEPINHQARQTPPRFRPDKVAANPPLQHMLVFQAQATPYGIAMVQADQLSDAAADNMKVCIIDSGYDINHKDLMSGANVSGEVSNTLTAVVDLGEWSTDSHGHGTHVAGIIAALDNTGGVAGVNPGGHIQLHNVKIIDHPGWWPYRGDGMTAAVARCQAAGANIINMSLAGPQSSAAEQAAMQTAYDAGILLVAASGNRGSINPYYPASYDAVIAVAAVDSAGDAWIFSHHNEQIELAAPGVAVWSTVPGDHYDRWDGTSMASAYVSGVAALVWSQHPQCDNRQIRAALQQSTQDLGDAGRDDIYGHGLVQAKAAAQWIDANGCDLSANIGFADLSWPLPASHPEQDDCGGIRQANFDANVYFVRTGNPAPIANLDIPTGYHWVSKTEYIELFNASMLASKNSSIFVYYGQCGLDAYPLLNRHERWIFLFNNGGTTGIHAGRYERYGASDQNDDAGSHLAGYVLYKDN